MDRLERIHRQNELRNSQKGGEISMYWITGILGLTLAAAPFLFGYTENTNALWVSLFLGMTTMIVSLYEALGHTRDRWEYWVALIAGLTAAAAPFVFQFGAVTAALWTTIAVGVILTGVAATKLFYGKAQFR